MQKFTQRLLETDKTIAEIPNELCFEDNKNLSHQFKQVNDCTPIEYRKNNLSGS